MAEGFTVGVTVPAPLTNSGKVLLSEIEFDSAIKAHIYVDMCRNAGYAVEHAIEDIRAAESAFQDLRSRAAE